jgi:type IV pilus assembly protein PilW
LKTSGDSTPRSKDDPLTLNPATDCLAEGIEQMHLEFGYDSDEDLVANQYISDITATQAELVVSIRIYLLVRSATADWSYTNSKTYNMGSMTMGPFNDNYYRRVYSTTVMLRNPTAFIGLL